jgi:hypothetical protein
MKLYRITSTGTLTPLCPIENLECKPIETIDIPVKDINEIQQNKCWRITKGGTIYKKLLNMGIDVRTCYVVEQNQ